uniref:Uncharacterized protein n=1 Tax=Myoviridae sp. ct4uh47 TaxID=2825032 RepID=A0A8S5V676_9CAUD|nr:MAG TPA: hypothetical protein [Myoviridae sp. ct4uh47]
MTESVTTWSPSTSRTRTLSRNTSQLPHSLQGAALIPINHSQSTEHRAHCGPVHVSARSERSESMPSSSRGLPHQPIN